MFDVAIGLSDLQPMSSVVNIYMVQNGQMAKCTSQQTRHIETMLFKCWASVADGGPTLNQHCFNVSCLMHGSHHDMRRGYRRGYNRQLLKR